MGGQHYANDARPLARADRREDGGPITFRRDEDDGLCSRGLDPPPLHLLFLVLLFLLFLLSSPAAEPLFKTQVRFSDARLFLIQAAAPSFARQRPGGWDGSPHHTWHRSP